MLYLSAFLHMSFCLSLWGTESLPYLLEFLISCLGCVSDPLFSCPAHIKHSKREKETERRAHKKYISEGIVAKLDVNGRGWLWKESGWRCQDNGKEKSWPMRYTQRKPMENQKGVGNTKRLIIISTDMPQKRSGSCQRLCSFCKITFLLYLIFKESGLISLPRAIYFYLLKLSV